MPTIIEKEGKWKAIVRRRELGGASRTRTFRLREDAEGWARRTEDELARGVWADERADPAAKLTLRDALDRYKATVLPGKRGKAQEASTIGILRDDSLARRTLARIAPADIAALRDRWTRDGLAAGTVRRRMHTLSHLFTVARQEWSMPNLANPCTGVRLPKEPPGRDRRVTDAEQSAIADAALNPDLPPFVALAAEIACRRGELAAAKWAHVDLKGKTLHFPKTKNGMARTVPLTPRALRVLRAMPRRIDGRVFGWTQPAAATMAFKRALARARAAYVAECKKRRREPDPTFLVGVRLHDLRHEGTSRLAKLLPVHALARVTGHKDLRMLMRYYNPTASELADMLAAASK